MKRRWQAVTTQNYGAVSDRLRRDLRVPCIASDDLIPHRWRKRARLFQRRAVQIQFGQRNDHRLDISRPQAVDELLEVLTTTMLSPSVGGVGRRPP